MDFCTVRGKARRSEAGGQRPGLSSSAASATTTIYARLCRKTRGTFTAGESLARPRIEGCNPSKSGTRAWGFHLREERNKALRLRVIPNICFNYELRGGADAGRAHYATLFHQRLHFT
jgi:hypothetical protein